MRKVYIDCGAFKGHPEYPAGYEVHCFEPNPHLYKILKKRKDIVFHPKAVWVMDGVIAMYWRKDRPTAKGASLYERRITGKFEDIEKDGVCCIDFALWLKDNVSVEDYVWVQMNIEGAEFAVIDHLEATDTIKLINRLDVSFHWERVDRENTESV